MLPHAQYSVTRSLTTVVSDRVFLLCGWPSKTLRNFLKSSSSLQMDIVLIRLRQWNLQKPSWICRKTKFNNRSGTVVYRTVEYWNRRPVGCEDMPRKSIDIRFSDYPILWKRGYCILFLPSGEDGCGQSPQNGSRDTSLVGFVATPQGFNHLICNFQGSMKPIF